MGCFYICWEKGYKRVELETDSLVAVRKINSPFDRIDPNIHLVEAIINFLNRNWLCSIKHIYREANVCADWLATHCDHLNLGLYILDLPHGEIMASLLADSIGIVTPRFM
ncbi:hypothetical protein REPUB_Repub14bG0004500 [Reevesia pubescens]